MTWPGFIILMIFYDYFSFEKSKSSDFHFSYDFLFAWVYLVYICCFLVYLNWILINFYRCNDKNIFKRGIKSIIVPGIVLGLQICYANSFLFEFPETVSRNILVINPLSKLTKSVDYVDGSTKQESFILYLNIKSSYNT